MVTVGIGGGERGSAAGDRSGWVGKVSKHREIL